MKVSIYYLTLSILIIILVYNILIYNNKKIENFISDTDTENIVNKFINKLDKKKKFKEDKKDIINLLPQCDADDNILINDFDNTGIITLSINNNKYGLIDNSNNYTIINTCASLSLKDVNTTSFIHNNTVYGNQNNYVENCNENNKDKDYGRINDNGFINDKSIYDIITDARRETYDDCIIFYDDYNSDTYNTVEYNDNIWGNTINHSILSYDKETIIDSLNCDLDTDNVNYIDPANSSSDIIINETVWGTTNNHIKPNSITSENYKQCAIKNNDIVNNKHTKDGITLINSAYTNDFKENCSKYNNKWGHVGDKEGEYIKNDVYEDIINKPDSCYTNTYLNKTDKFMLNQINYGKIGIDNYIKKDECLKKDQDNKIDANWGLLDHYSISTNGLWPDSLDEEIANCAQCIGDKCRYLEDVWDKKKIIQNSECTIRIDDDDGTKLNDGTNNWYSDDVSITKTQGNEIIKNILKAEFENGMEKYNYDNCAIKYSDIYGYTDDIDTNNWSMSGVSDATILDIKAKQNEILEVYANEDCLLPYSSFFGQIGDTKYEYNNNISYGKIIDPPDDYMSPTEEGYVKNKYFKDKIKKRVRENDSCIFNNDEISSTSPLIVYEKNNPDGKQWGKISIPPYYELDVYNENINGSYIIQLKNDEYVEIDKWKENLEEIEHNKIYNNSFCYKSYNITLKRKDNPQNSNDIIKVKIYEVINMFTNDQNIIEPPIVDLELQEKEDRIDNIISLKTYTMYKIVPYDGYGWNGGSFTIYGDDEEYSSDIWPYIYQEENNIFSSSPPSHKYLYVYPLINYGFLDYTYEMKKYD